MASYNIPFWKQTPILRLLLPFIAGIVCQWYVGFSLIVLLYLFLACVAILLCFKLMPFDRAYRWRWVPGVAISCAFFVVGSFVCYKADIRHNNNWVGRYYTDSSAVLVTIQEPLVEKSKSYKALAEVNAVALDGRLQPVSGKVLLYFRKDSLPPDLAYGSQLVFLKPLQAITNSGNPGCFDYQRYSAFHDIYHQCFLRKGEYRLLSSKGGNRFRQTLFALRTWVVNTLRKYIKGSMEQGVAEALLIGYRDDLDKNLVQAYSNTGVVHIIAISGLHLGMIYGTLIWLFGRFKKRRWLKWAKPIIILVVLWLFSLVAGAAPSILRSAVMFSFLLAAEMMNRRQSVYNTLGASAFVMLCFDPFALWDVGFQLSYAAVLSILVFMKPISNWFYIPNKALNKIWELNAVTLSAQVLTIPIVCFYFHQLPNYFLITNLVVVPLSSIILYGELCLVLLGGFFSAAAVLVGKITSALLWFMNAFITRIDDLPFAVFPAIQISVLQTMLLYGCVLTMACWLLLRNKKALYGCLAFSMLFVVSRTINFYNASVHDKMIVYNIPQHTAIDFLHGRSYQFAGDTMLLTDDFLQNFHLKPGRILNRQIVAPLNTLASAWPFYIFNNKKVLLIDRPLRFASGDKPAVDVLILSKNPNVHLDQLSSAFNIGLVVFDGSNSVWKISQWKKECDKLHLRHYSTPDQGALILDL